MPFEKVEFQFPDEEPAADEKKEVVAEETKEPPKTESEIEVEVVDDTPPEDRGKKPVEPPPEVTEDELADYSDRVKKRIQHLSRGYHDERRKAEAAQREREEAIRYAQAQLEENQRLKESYEKAQAALIEQAKARTAMELEQAKRAYKAAYESGDSDKLVTAQEALTSAKIRADKVAAWKPALQPKETPVKTAPEPAPAPQADQKALAWQQENKWFGSDEEMTSLALGLHQKLVREGINPQSDEYYDRINRRMRQLFPDQFDDPEPEPEKPKRTNVVAPATRSVAPQKVKLTGSAVNLAKKLGITPEQYAREVALLKMRSQNG